MQFGVMIQNAVFSIDLASTNFAIKLCITQYPESSRDLIPAVTLCFYISSQ